MNPTQNPVSASANEEGEIDLRELWAAFRRNRRLIALCSLASLLIGVAWVRITAPVYEATASIRIDKSGGSLPILEELTTLSSGTNEIETDRQVLSSRTLAEAVIDSLRLEARLTYPRHVSRLGVLSSLEVLNPAAQAVYSITRLSNGEFEIADPNGGSNDRRRARVGDLVKMPGASFTLAQGALAYPSLRLELTPRANVITDLRNGALKIVQPVKEADVLTITYAGTDSQLVRDVPNVLANAYIMRRQADQRGSAKSTVTFIKTEIDSLTRQLDAAEDALMAFRQREHVVNLDAQGTAAVSYAASLQAKRDEVADQRAALSGIIASIRSDTVSRVADAPSPYRRLLGFPAILQSPTAGQLLSAISALEDQRSALLTRRTPADPGVQMLNERIHELEKQVGGLVDTYVASLGAQERAADKTLASLHSTLDSVPQTDMQYARLESRAKLLEGVNTLLQTKLQDAQIAAAAVDPTIHIVDLAELPGPSIKPRRGLSLAVALLIGLAIGCLIAFLREFVDRAIHTRDQLQLATGVPILGMVPNLQSTAILGRTRRGALRYLIPRQLLIRAGAESLGRVLERTGAKRPTVDVLVPQLVSRTDPRNPLSEAYRGLRTNITFAQPGRVMKTIAFTSSMPEEGKSTSSTNTAFTLAQQGARVLLIDADMRRGLMHELFEQPREPGLSNVLIGVTRPEVAIRTIELASADTVGRLDLLTTGTVPPNPAELLGSERMQSLLQEFAASYDAIVIDTPPLNLVTDAAIVGAKVDGVIVVARAGVTTSEALSYAMDQLRAVRANVLGTVLNGVDFSRDSRYAGYSSKYAGYQHYYALGE